MVGCRTGPRRSLRFRAQGSVPMTTTEPTQQPDGTWALHQEWASGVSSTITWRHYPTAEQIERARTEPPPPVEGPCEFSARRWAFDAIWSKETGPPAWRWPRVQVSVKGDRAHVRIGWRMTAYGFSVARDMERQ